jgi:hypothetical protein
MMRFAFRILLAAFLLAPFLSAAQSNPYLDRKKKNKPSVQQARENRKHLKKQKKLARKQMRRSKREIGRANRRRMKGK